MGMVVEGDDEYAPMTGAAAAGKHLAAEPAVSESVGMQAQPAPSFCSRSFTLSPARCRDRTDGVGTHHRRTRACRARIFAHPSLQPLPARGFAQPQLQR